MNCTFSILDKKHLCEIQGLWERLNEIHLNDSIHFKNYFKSFTFEQRCEKFSRISECNIRIEVILDADIYIGYCISTIEKSTGEIDSLFVESKYRNHGFGRKLIENSLNWFKENGCPKIVVAVAEGHESVIAFYQKLGFYPRMTYLQLKE